MSKKQHVGGKKTKTAPVVLLRQTATPSTTRLEIKTSLADGGKGGDHSLTAGTGNTGTGGTATTGGNGGAISMINSDKAANSITISTAVTPSNELNLKKISPPNLKEKKKKLKKSPVNKVELTEEEKEEKRRRDNERAERMNPNNKKFAGSEVAAVTGKKDKKVKIKIKKEKTLYPASGTSTSKSKSSSSTTTTTTSTTSATSTTTTTDNNNNKNNKNNNNNNNYTNNIPTIKTLQKNSGVKISTPPASQNAKYPRHKSDTPKNRSKKEKPASVVQCLSVTSDNLVKLLSLLRKTDKSAGLPDDDDDDDSVVHVPYPLQGLKRTMMSMNFNKLRDLFEYIANPATNPREDDYMDILGGLTNAEIPPAVNETLKRFTEGTDFTTGKKKAGAKSVNNRPVASPNTSSSSSSSAAAAAAAVSTPMTVPALVASLTLLMNLRTPLGGPRETLEQFEQALKGDVDDSGMFVSLTALNNLLAFFTEFEKQMIMLTAGSHFSPPLHPPLHPHIAFFLTNLPTTTQWLSSRRLHLFKASISSGNARGSVEHGLRCLEGMIAGGNNSGFEFYEGYDPKEIYSPRKDASAVTYLKINSDAAKQTVVSLESNLRLLADSMVSTRCPDSIVGLKEWFIERIRNSPGNSNFLDGGKCVGGDLTKPLSKRCLWMDAMICRCEGRLEESLRICLGCLWLGEFVWGPDWDGGIEFGSYYFENHPAAGKTPLEVAKFSLKHLSYTFFSLSGVQACVQTAFDCLNDLGEYERLDKFLLVLGEMRSVIEKNNAAVIARKNRAGDGDGNGNGNGNEEKSGKNGNPRQQKSKSNKSQKNHVNIITQVELLGPNTKMYLGRVPEKPTATPSIWKSVLPDGKEVLKSRYTDYMGNALLSAGSEDSFRPKFDRELLNAWKSVDEIVNTKTSSTTEHDMKLGDDVNAKLRALTESYEDFPLSLSLQPLQSRVEAVERTLLYSVARVDDVQTNQEIQLVVARNLARCTRCLLNPLTQSMDGMRHSNGNLANLVESCEIVNRRVNYAARTHTNKTAAELSETFDEFNCSFGDLRKLSLIRSALNFEGDDPDLSRLHLCKLARKQNNLSTAARLLSQTTSTSNFRSYESIHLDFERAPRRSTSQHAAISALVTLAGNISEEEGENHYKTRSYLRAASWLQSMGDIFNSSLTFTGNAPAAAMTNNELFGWKTNTFSHYIGDCLVNASKLCGGNNSKSNLRLADFGFTCWVRLMKIDSANTAANTNDVDVLNNLHELSFTHYCKVLTLPTNANHFTSVTLRLMKLIVHRNKSADLTKLKNLLENTPARCWLAILPQLFSLIGYKDEFSRKMATEILETVSTNEKKSTAKVAFDVCRGFSGLEDYHQSEGEQPIVDARKKQVSLQRLRQHLQKSNGSLYDDVLKFQIQIDKLSSLWGDRWKSLIERVHAKSAEFMKRPVEVFNADVGFNVAKMVKTFMTLNRQKRENASKLFQREFQVSSEKYVQELLSLARQTLSPDMVDEIDGKVVAKSTNIATEADLDSAFPTLNVSTSAVSSSKQLPARPSGVTPETLYEKEFQSTVGTHILRLIKIFKADVATTPIAFQKQFDDCCVKIVTGIYSIKDRKLEKSMKTICPQLNDVLRSASSLFFLPGVPARIVGTVDDIVVIPTKQQPKKITFLDNTMAKHSFLLKGGEDLRVDERMMQMLEVTNTLLKANCDKETRMRKLATKSYAVLPVSQKSGLLKWVENVVPLYSLLKDYQRRDAERTKIAKEIMNDKSGGGAGASSNKKVSDDVGNNKHRDDGGDESSNPHSWQNVARQYLISKKLDPKTPHENWNFNTRMGIFNKMQEITPSNLLEREIFSSSLTMSTFFEKRHTFTKSLATSSATGFLMGLGDRHPNNLMVDFNTGEIVHIDYGVIFNQGRALKVPELVPFRLTQNLIAALGVGGLWGNFHMCLTSVLKALRENKAVILTLLEAFVHDPVRGKDVVLPDPEELKCAAKQKKYRPLLVTTPGATAKLSNEEAAELENVRKIVSSATVFVQNLELRTTLCEEKMSRIKAFDEQLDNELILPSLKCSVAEVEKLEMLCGSSIMTTKLAEFEAVEVPRKKNEWEARLTSCQQTWDNFEPADIPVINATWESLKMKNGPAMTTNSMLRDVEGLIQQSITTLIITNKLIEMAKVERSDFVFGCKFAAWLRRLDAIKAQRALQIDSALIHPVQLNCDLFTNVVKFEEEIATLSRSTRNMHRHLPILVKSLSKQDGVALLQLSDVLIDSLTKASAIVKGIIDMEYLQTDDGVDGEDDGDNPNPDVLEAFFCGYQALVKAARRESLMMALLRRIKDRRERVEKEIEKEKASKVQPAQPTLAWSKMVKEGPAAPAETSEVVRSPAVAGWSVKAAIAAFDHAEWKKLSTVIRSFKKVSGEASSSNVTRVFCDNVNVGGEVDRALKIAGSDFDTCNPNNSVEGFKLLTAKGATTESILDGLVGDDNDKFFLADRLRKDVEACNKNKNELLDASKLLLDKGRAIIAEGKKFIAEKNGEGNQNDVTAKQAKEEGGRKSQDGWVKGSNVIKLVRTNLEVEAKELIMAARDTEKLALMYEGWSAWY